MRHIVWRGTFGLSLCAAAAAFPNDLYGAINLELRPEAELVTPGESVRIGLFAVPDGGTEQSFVGLDLILLWDPVALRYVDVVDDGPVDWFLFGLHDDSELDGLNDSTADGDLFFQVFSFTDVTVPVEGLLIGTFVFEGRRAAKATELIIPPERGQYTKTRVITGTGAIVTGTLGTATLTVVCVPAAEARPEMLVSAQGPLVVSTKHRFLSVSTRDLAGRNADRSHAVRVRFSTMPGGFETLEGLQLWVRVPAGTPADPEFLSSMPGLGWSDPVPSSDRKFVRVASLACGPPVSWDDPAFFRAWADLKACRGGEKNATGCDRDADCPGGTCGRDEFIHIYHSLLVPGGTYTVEVLDIACDAADESTYSDSLPLATSMFGDVAGEFSLKMQVWSAPDAMATVSIDVLALMDALLGRPVGPIKPRADLVGFDASRPDGAVRIGDVLVGIDAALGKPFTSSPAAPTPADPCAP